jgi:hypothetical protein
MGSMGSADRAKITNPGYRPAPFREGAAAFLDKSTDAAN